VGGMLRTSPLIALLFLIPALSIAGFPPFSGFIAKLALIIAGFEAHRFVVVSVSLGVGLLTLYVMIRIWIGVFWSPQEEAEPAGARGTTERFGAPPLMLGATAALVAVTLVIAI